MKKYIVILFVIMFSIIVVTFFTRNFFVKKEVYNPIFYQAIVKQNENLDTSLQTNDFKVTLKGLYTDKITDEQFFSLNLDEATIDNIKKLQNTDYTNYSLLVDFSTTDKSQISQPIFDYIVYDNCGKVIMTSMIYKKDSPKTNQFLEYFMKKEHNSNNILEFGNYILPLNGETTSVVKNAENSNLILISASINKNEPRVLDTSKIHILIINPSYRNNKSTDRIYLDDTVFEFILEN